MSHPVDVHPEDLLDRKRQGPLSSEEQRRLKAHARHCQACALESLAVADFAREQMIDASDQPMVSRLVDGALAQASGMRGAPAWTGDGRRRRRRAWAVGAAVAFAATGAIGGLWSVKRAVWPTRSEAPQVPAAWKSPVALGKGVAPGPSRAELALPEDPERAEPAPAVVASPSEPSEPSRARSSAALDRGSPEPTAAEMFATANDARRNGELSDAVRLYRQLQQRFSGSREEVMSRVALARLMLDRLDDPSGALALFDHYLAASAGGTLAEEARLGRALALMRLGRSVEESQAWRALLSAHPSSIYAERARRRLTELR